MFVTKEPYFWITASKISKEHENGETVMVIHTEKGDLKVFANEAEYLYEATSNETEIVNYQLHNFVIDAFLYESRLLGNDLILIVTATLPESTPKYINHFIIRWDDFIYFDFTS